jgi:hypothetical protein
VLVSLLLFSLLLYRLFLVMTDLVLVSFSRNRAQFILSTVASLKLVENASDFTGYWMTDLKFHMVITLFLCFFRATAAVYFSRRMWGVSLHLDVTTRLETMTMGGRS